MSKRDFIGKLLGALAVASLFGFAACQQVLGLDQPTVSISAISRICECVPLIQQGLAFAGSATAACDEALAVQPDELLLAVAENDCTDCANVTSCYALLTEAGDDGDACADSSDCASWSCCQGVLSVRLIFEMGGFAPVLDSTPSEAVCCASCQSCGDAFANLNTESEVIACAEAEVPLYALLECLAEGASGDCECGPPNGVTQACLGCLVEKAANENRCGEVFEACVADPARPIPVPQ